MRGDNGGGEDEEERDGGGVVEEAFALDEPGQALGRPDLAEDGDDGDRIGGRDQRAEEKAGQKRHPRQGPESETDAEGRDDDRDQRHDEDRQKILPHPVHIDAESALEDQGWQEDIEEQARAHRQAEQLLGQFGRQDGAGMVERMKADDAERDATGREHDRSRQSQPAPERTRQRPEGDKARNENDGGDDRHGA